MIQVKQYVDIISQNIIYAKSNYAKYIYIT